MTTPTTPPAFVTQEQAARQVSEAFAGMLPEKLQQLDDAIALASGYVLNRMKAQGDPTWTPDTAPANVRLATLTLIGAIWRHRGDDEEQHKAVAGALGTVDLILVSLRDPAVAAPGTAAKV